MKNQFSKLIVLVMVLSLFLPGRAAAQVEGTTFTILHTNDFHGNLEPAGSNPGAARVAAVINAVRDEVGADNVLLLDAGDEMQGSLLSNLTDGIPTIDYFNTIGYDAATFGNHEFDWGQTVLADRLEQAQYPFLAANVTMEGEGGVCDDTTWTPATFTPTSGTPITVEPYTFLEVAGVTVGVIGVTTTETPFITIVEATEGLCFQDPAEAIGRVYAEVAAQADVIVVLSHLGVNDGGYGYGFQVIGDMTLAQQLIDAGTPVDLIIGGHSHTKFNGQPIIVGDTVIGQAHYAGRRVGRADITVSPTGDVSITWTDIPVSTSGPQDQDILALIESYTNDPDYQELISQEVGWTQVNLVRDYNGDNMMGTFVNDAIYNFFNEDLDGDPELSVDMVFNNPGGLRIDVCATENCAPGLLDEPFLLTYGDLFSVLPFGNQTVIGEMTGAEILDLLHQSAMLTKGAIQVAGVRYSFVHNRLADPTPGVNMVLSAEVWDRATETWVPIDPATTYIIATNEFLAPAGQDNFLAFQGIENYTYHGDMLDQVIAYSQATYTQENPYRGPTGDGTLDARIQRMFANFLPVLAATPQ